MRLEGRVAIVTGGARGIGKAECLALAREGASVIVNDFGGGADGTGRATEPAAEVADEITANGGKAVPHFGDVSQMKTGEELVQTALNEFGRLDILVNTACQTVRRPVGKDCPPPLSLSVLSYCGHCV